MSLDGPVIVLTDETGSFHWHYEKTSFTDCKIWELENTVEYGWQQCCVIVLSTLQERYCSCFYSSSCNLQWLPCCLACRLVHKECQGQDKYSGGGMKTYCTVEALQCFVDSSFRCFRSTTLPPVMILIPLDHIHTEFTQPSSCILHVGWGTEKLLTWPPRSSLSIWTNKKTYFFRSHQIQ